MTINLAAARFVHDYATDAADERMLLEMLGLIDDAGRITPDDTRTLPLEVPLAAVANREPTSVQWWTDKPEVSTAPEALRTLAPPSRRPAKRTDGCGKASGYKQHHRRGEEACRACKDAHNADRRKRRESSESRGQITYPECGTAAGYQRHRAGKNRVCDVCKEAAA